MKLNLGHTDLRADRGNGLPALSSLKEEESFSPVISPENLKVQMDFLGQQLLPKLLVTYGVGFYRPFRLWCMECPHPALPLEFVRALKLFQKGMPNFAFQVLVTDGSPERTAAARGLFRECYTDSSLEACVDFQQLPPSRIELSVRMPQDLIVCNANLDALDRADREKFVQSFTQLLFPGRILMGSDLEEALKEVPVFQKIETGVFRRLSES